MLRTAKQVELVFLCFLVLGLSIPQIAHPRPPKRFHEGPYLQLLAGARQSSNDDNFQIGRPVGRDTEPVFGFFFGWNVTDPAAVEIVGRYSTAATFGSREHLVRVNLNLRWHWLTERLTRSRAIQILPFLHGGPFLDIAVLPSATGATDSAATQWGGGWSSGGGVSFLMKEYIYVSVLAQADFIRRASVTQTVGSGPVLVYPGGWAAEWSAVTGLGVHF